MVMGVFRFLNASTPTAAPRNPLVLDFCFWLLFVAFATVGALVASRWPKNAIGWIFWWLGFSFLLVGASEEYALYALVTEARRWRPVVWIDLVAVACLVAWAFGPGTLENLALVRVSNPFGIEGAAALLGTLGWVGLFVTLAVTVAGGVSLVVRFRGARGVERQQIKWLTFSGIVFCAVFAAAPFLWSLPQSPATAWIWPVLFLAGASTVPVAVGIAILRHQLYDIDLIINRALVYGSLTVALALTYLGSVVALQHGFRAISGGTSQLAVVASTLAIAVLFNPLRRRVQASVDRRFYRRKYDAAKTLDAFSVRLRDETRLDALSEDLVGVVTKTVQPAHASLWLRPETGAKGEQAD
jgi:hypothetical protein